ncbi:MAG: acyl-CoA dehydrogenase family protein, partial [Thermacetogeniaceae bacterium]
MWYMNEERKMLQKMIKEFTQNEIKPFIAQMEENDTYPKEILKKLGELGVLGLCLDEKYGGSGEDWISMGIVLEEIAKESNTVALLTALASDITAHMIAPYCTPEQIEKFIKPAVKGEILLANWATEPCGIFNIGEYETTAVLEGDEWVVNGGKIFATNAGQCDYAFVVCRTNENANAAAMDGWSWIMIPANSDGFKVGHIENKLGWKGSSTGQVYFNNVRVPKENLIGEKDKAFQYLVERLVPGYCLYGAWTLGSAEGVYEKTKKFLQE